MTSIHSNIVRLLLAVALIAASAGFASAHYDHDKKGWYDEHHQRHDFTKYHGHRGYWDKDDKGAKIFIRI